MTLSLPASCHVGITHDTITRSTLIGESWPVKPAAEYAALHWDAMLCNSRLLA